MPYHIRAVRHALFPNAQEAEHALSAFGLPLQTLLDAFRGYSCPAHITAGRGYQMDVADDLERYLERTLAYGQLRPTRSRYELKYSSTLNQHADFGLIDDGTKTRILFEVEFRPNYEKDLVKFQIGANSGILAAGIMVVVTDRKSINPGYTTMPEFDSVVRVVTELKPTYALVIVGLEGRHAA